MAKFINSCTCHWCMEIKKSDRKRFWERVVARTVATMLIGIVLGIIFSPIIMAILGMIDDNPVPPALRNASVPVMNNVEPDQRP